MNKTTNARPGVQTWAKIQDLNKQKRVAGLQNKALMAMIVIAFVQAVVVVIISACNAPEYYTMIQ